MKGTLYLIPTTLGESPVENVIPAIIKNVINTIDDYIVEDIKSARRYLKKLGIKKAIDALNFYELNKHTTCAEISGFIKPALENRNMGIISEAGNPGIADPGSVIVKLAHENQIKVVPLTGPSSILLALIASGMNGQNFAFNGYLPKNSDERKKKLIELEKRSQRENQTQIFMETPFRNTHIIEDIISVCNKSTCLCIACDITLETEFIRTMTIAEWEKNVPDIDKRPAIFVIHRY